MTDSRDEAGMTGNDCQRAIELLPWFERGTLGEEERRFVAGHLETCADCRDQLAATRHIAWITRQHLPAEVLADLACDLEPDDASWPREEIEAHLELCPSCRQELAVARGAAPPAPALRFPERLPQRFWRPVALAASLVATLTVASLLWQQQQQQQQTAEIATGGALVELVPESYRTRDGAEAATVLARDRPATLLLVTLAADPAIDGAPRRALLTTTAGQVVHQVEDLVADEAGTVVLHVPAGTLPAGSVEVALQASGPTGWTTLETYRFDVR